jgi:hypothetical protein
MNVALNDWIPICRTDIGNSLIKTVMLKQQHRHKDRINTRKSAFSSRA